MGKKQKAARSISPARTKETDESGQQPMKAEETPTKPKWEGLCIGIDLGTTNSCKTSNSCFTTAAPSFGLVCRCGHLEEG
jgi:hypothetical protein